MEHCEWLQPLIFTSLVTVSVPRVSEVLGSLLVILLTLTHTSEPKALIQCQQF